MPVLRALAALALTVSLAGCTVTPPTAPDANDPAYAVGPLPRWPLIGNALTPGLDGFTVTVNPPPDTAGVHAWLDGEPLGQLEASEDALELDVSLADVSVGEHELLLALPGDDLAFHAHRFVRSHPLYVFVSVDWDQADTSDGELAWQDSLHAGHPELRITQFVGPYSFTDPDMADRRQLLVDWLQANEAAHGDETGLHIHPRCVWVDTTSVPCRTEPSYVDDDGDDTGYTVLSTAYTEEEFTALVAHADGLFVDHGFAKPTSYRAGGWIADVTTLRALAANGYVADTSANNWRRLEEWEGQANNVLWEWNQEHWSSIDERSQPYRPSVADVLVPGTPDVGLLEVPDNGILADYVETEEMVEMLAANWDGGGLAAPTAYSIGFHNRTVSGPNTAIRTRMEGALDHIDQFLAADDAGPIVYATLSEAPLVWP